MIKRAAGETALPITTLNIEELQKAGVTTAEQAVQFITENQSASQIRQVRSEDPTAELHTPTCAASDHSEPWFCSMVSGS